MDAMKAFYADCDVLLVPSAAETFGMVYPEALFAGTPILHTLGSGIDGYLDGLDVGVAVRPGNVDDIAAGLVRLVEDNAAFRAAIAAASPVLYERLAPERTLARYRAAVAEVVRDRRRDDVSDRRETPSARRRDSGATGGAARTAAGAAIPARAAASHPVPGAACRSGSRRRRRRRE